jgi:hypothetical protein
MDLHGYSRLVDLLALSKANGTHQLAGFIRSWAHSRNLVCEQEVHVGACRQLKKSGYLYRGYLDFVIDRRLAIEIDSTNKRWSLIKLEHAAQVGLAPVWIRWCSAQKLCVPVCV